MRFFSVDTFLGNKDTIPPTEEGYCIKVSSLFFGPFIVLIGEGILQDTNTIERVAQYRLTFPCG